MDFDSAIPWFESRRPSQILSDKINDIEITEQRAGAIFMLHRVAKISKYFLMVIRFREGNFLGPIVGRKLLELHRGELLA